MKELTGWESDRNSERATARHDLAGTGLKCSAEISSREARARKVFHIDFAGKTRQSKRRAQRFGLVDFDFLDVFQKKLAELALNSWSATEFISFF